MYIHRNSESYLKEWVKKHERKPLIIRGARQTGKSRLVEEFGSKNFEFLVTVNFEKEPHLKSLFDKSDPLETIRELEIIKNTPIRPGKTLLFIDEIQEHPRAIERLRYFYEDASEYHIIAAGSLLEFVLENEKLSFPVGRVDFHYLYPLTFYEFLMGCGSDRLASEIKSATFKDGIQESIHNELRKKLQTYLLVGGMPEASRMFIETQKYFDVDEIRESLVETYRDDFKKYSRRVNIDNLDMIFKESPGWIGRRANLSKMGLGEVGSRDAGVAVRLLERAMILHRVNRLQSVSFPLIPFQRTQPKIVFLDVGLAQYMNNMSEEILQSKNFNVIHKGGLAEQLVGQELLPIVGHQRRPELFYWQREAKGADAEVDFVIPFGSHLIPIEVKYGSRGTLYSLNQFIAENKPPCAIRIYDGPLRLEDQGCKLLSLPLYMVSEVPRLLTGLLGSPK